MDNLVIPSNPIWYSNACFCPDKGLLYASNTKIVYIPSKEDLISNKVKEFDVKTKINSFACDNDWSETRYFAVINGDFSVLIYDFDKGPLKGHKGHLEVHPTNSKIFSALCFLDNKQVISTKNSDLIKYCLVSNSYKFFVDFSKKNPVTVLKSSPYNSNIFAAGTKNGLILIATVDKLEIKFKLRGHDTEITCLDWISFPTDILEKLEDVVKKEIKPKPQKKKSAPPAKNLDDDLFDIYSFDHLEDEFGTFAPGTSVEVEPEENSMDVAEPQANSNFNFLEACQSLKNDIIGNDGDACNPNIDKSKDTFEANKDQYGVKNENDSHDESMESIQSSHTPTLSDSSINYMEECQRLKDFMHEKSFEDAGRVFLTSGSKENYLLLWDSRNGIQTGKINWHNKTKSCLPAPFTNFVWITDRQLILTDSNGDLLEFMVTFHQKKNDFIAQKTERNFNVKGVLNICKSLDGSHIWTSSIHRQISCLNVADCSKQIVNDTMQIRIHYILENPFDSNVIGISGNDKRIVLWNVSNTSQFNINLIPFMNRIHSAVLCLSWHPVDDHVLAFSTREGRIGYFTTKKSTNVPHILKPFSNKEIYSIAYAKVMRNDKDMILLLACDGLRFVFYQQNSKHQLIPEYSEVKHLSKSTSISVNGNLAAVGNQQGHLNICDIAGDFKILRTFKLAIKYVGHSTWFGRKLIVCAENNVHELDLTGNFQDAESIVNIRTAKGHTSRITSARYNNNGKRMVSCCFSGSVKVWDLETPEISCLGTYTVETQLYSAIFMPTDENKVICGGQNTTVIVFDWAKQFASNEEGSGKPKLASKSDKNFWAKQSEEIVAIKGKYNKRKIEASQSNNTIDDVVTDIQGIKLDNTPKKVTTLFYMSSKELTNDTMKLLKHILNENDRELSFNERLFLDRNVLKTVIQDESDAYKTNAMVKAPGTMVLPLLNDDLKSEIVNKIAAKMLTETDIALAPNVSYEFWRNCCHAFAIQCIEADEFIRAIPYLLSCNEIDLLLNTLCEQNYYREAWIIAKMRKTEEDPILETIFQKWITYCDSTGFYEAAAALYCCKKDFKSALEILIKRKIKNDECKEVMEILYKKLDAIATSTE